MPFQKMPFEMSDEFRLFPAHLRTRDFSREGCERTDIPLPAALRAGQAVYKPVFAPNFRISDCENGFSDQSGALGGELWPTRHELVAGVHVSCVMKIVVESHRCRMDVGLQRVVGIRSCPWSSPASFYLAASNLTRCRRQTVSVGTKPCNLGPAARYRGLLFWV